MQPAPAPIPARLTLARARTILAPFTRRIFVVIGLGLVIATVGAAQPLLLKFLFDELERAGASRTLALAVAALFVVETARTALNGWLTVATWNLRFAVDYALRERLIGKLALLPMSFHQKASVGGLMNRMNQGISGFVNAFGEVALNVIPAVGYLVLAVLAMVRMEWRLALFVLAFTPLPMLIGAWAATEQARRERILLDRWTTLYGRLSEVLAGIRTVKAFAMEEVERRRFLSGQREGNAVCQRGIARDATTGALRDLCATLARLAAIAAGAWLIARGEMTVGSLVAVLGYVGGLFGPVQGLTNSYQALQRGAVSLESVFEILDTPDPTRDAPDAYALPPVRGEVRFEGVSFAYDDSAPVLRDVTIHAAAGETVAIVGQSGSGKTTLVALLQRMHQPTGGRVLVDGHDVAAVTQHSLRQQVGVVHQDVNLFNDTIRDNIAYGRPTASDEEIEAAARAANAHEFIMALPEGYDTVVGEHGSRLSGGQRQRIGIARALLKDAPVLVLDEATSALDAAYEAAVQEALRTLTRGRTTFVIAHRLATVVHATRIVVLCDGRVTAVGTHGQLMREGGFYASLVRRQMLTQAA
jgi:ATP-binding cassette, subfamily B, bacterial